MTLSRANEFISFDWLELCVEIEAPTTLIANLTDAIRLPAGCSRNRSYPTVTYSIGQTNGCFQVYRNGLLAAERVNWISLLRSIDSLVHQDLASKTKKMTVLHAAVAAWRGQSLLLPGHSRSGKSTLLKCLVGAGAVYYSDEFALIDDLGQAWPFPRPISIRLPDGNNLNQTLWSSKDDSAFPTPISWIGFLQFDPVVRERYSKISLAASVLEMMKYCINIDCDPQVNLQRLAKCSSKAYSFRGRRGDCVTELPILLELLDKEVVQSDTGSITSN